MLNGADTICHGWRPERGFLPYRWQGYDEALILYLLALGSPTHPISPACYEAWCSTYEWKEIYGIDFLYAGPLFVHQMSHIWCDFQGIRDRYMRERDSDYFENSRRATLVQHRYAIRNPNGFKHLSADCWGISASDGPGDHIKEISGVRRVFFDYVARGVPYGPDDGTLAPWAVAASMPFADDPPPEGTSHQGSQSLRVQGIVQPRLLGRCRWCRLGVTLSLRHQRGAHGAHDRKPPDRVDLVIDAALQSAGSRPSGRRLRRRVARQARLLIFP